MSRKVFSISAIVAVLGLAAQLLALINWRAGTVVLNIAKHGNTLNLNYFNSWSFYYYNIDSGLTFNYPVFAAYSLLLIGALAYYRSNGKETRLVRFIMALVFITNISYTVNSIFTPFFYRLNFIYTFSDWLAHYGVGILRFLIVGYLAWYVLRTIGRTKTILPVSAEGVNGGAMEKASRWKRLVNVVIDTYLCILIFSPLAPGMSFFIRLEEITDERTALYAFIVLARIIYYLFFELLLKASPAKYLTETRVVTQDGNAPSSMAIVSRTFSRLIPFEAFSFLGKRGWHDSISNTIVVNEVRTGIKGRYYLLILPAILVISVGSYIIHELYEDYKYKAFEKEKYEKHVTNLLTQLVNLSANHVIEIEDIRNLGNRTLLKVEEANGDDIVASVVIMEENYSDNLFIAEKFYYASKQNGSLRTVNIKRSDVEKAITDDYKKYNSLQRSTFPLLQNDQRYEVKQIMRFGRPCLMHGSTSSLTGGTLSMSIENLGWPAMLTKVDILDGSFTWTKELPLKVLAASSYGRASGFALTLNEYESKERYKVRLTLTDSLGNNHLYIVEGSNFDYEILEMN